MSERILCVDDDSNFLEALRRQFRKQFDIDVALGGAEGLNVIAAQGPFAVVVSDMRMPGMDGIRFLSAVREQAPESVRVMLTGNADQQVAVDAVNEGEIFRFLIKPCAPETLAKTFVASVKQYKLVTAEKELLEKTLEGSVKTLTDVLSLTNPAAFGCASRVRRLVQKLCKQLKVDQAWQCEIAAMLSQIGCVTVPSSTLNKIYHGQRLLENETHMLAAHPAVGRELVANIPRLEAVAEIIGYQQKCFDGSGPPADSVAGTDIPLGARILKVAIDCDALKWSGLTDGEVIAELHEHQGWYDPDVLAALDGVTGFEEGLEVREVALKDLTTRMILATDITTISGTLLVGKGQEVSVSMLRRLKNFALNGRITSPIRVFVGAESNPRAAVSAGR